MRDISPKSSSATGVALLALALFFCTPAQAAQSLAIVWDPSPSPNVAGYIIYYGTDETNLDSLMVVGNNTFATVTNLQPDTTYYFDVVAYNVNNVQSPPSNLIEYTVPAVMQTVSLLANPANAGSVTGAGAFAAGSSVTVTATANGGYTFSNWTENGIVQCASPNYSFTLATNRNLLANFTVNPVTYTVAAQISPANAGSVTGAGAFAAGSSVTVTATANSGYTFTNWTENGIVQCASPNYSFTLAANRNLVANFTVAIKGNPRLTISSPRSGQSVSNAFVLVTGTVTDRAAVDNVFYQLNGGSWTPATPSNSWSNWTARVIPNRGANTIRAYAQDTSGALSTTNSVTFKFIPCATLVVLTNGLGSITPNDNNELLALGASYTLKATPVGSNLFSNWIGGTALPYAVLSTSASYTFPMQSNLVLVANFVPNPFIPERGTFNGLFWDTNEVQEASSGFFTLTLTRSGTFTGKIRTSGNTYTLPTTTKFDVGGQVQFTVPTKQNILTFNLQLDITNPASEQITGTVSDGNWTAELTADRAVFSASSNKAINYEGRYTLAIAGSDDAAASPGGFGCATLSISSAGLLTMSGNLADGKAMSQSVSVSKDGRWPFYASYAAPPAGNGGAVFSWITFSNLPASALGGTMYWFRPAGKAPAVYQSGFTNLMVPVIGSAYNPTDMPLLALTSGQVTLDGGNLPVAITNQITLAANNIITLTTASENSDKLDLTINKTNGAITGTFANPSHPGQTVKIRGVLLQNQTNAVGYFLGTNQSGAFLFENP